MGKDYYYNAFKDDDAKVQHDSQSSKYDNSTTAEAIESHLEIKLFLGVLATICTFLKLLRILVDIELGKKMRKTVAEATNETGLTEEGPRSEVKGATIAVITNASVVQMPNDNSPLGSGSAAAGVVPVEEEPSSMYSSSPLQALQESTPVALLGTTLALTLVVFLLLVFDPSGVIWLNIIALACVTGAFFQSQIASELRHKRYDRIASIFTLIIFLGASLSLTTYANLALREGIIYQGPARIIGYDDSVYLDKNQESVTRADLEVSFGQAWACPGMDKTCYVTVQGALCQEKHHNRLLGKEEIDDSVLVEIDEEVEEVAIEGAEYEMEAEMEEEDNEELESEVEEEAEDNEELEDEVEELEDENEKDEEKLAAQKNSNSTSASSEADKEEEEELEEEVEDLEEEVEEEAEENEDLENSLYYEEYYYSFEDDVFEDEYWQSVSWGDTWGDFQCQDLFNADLESSNYDVTSPPGNDGWPFINIYGQCNSCDAYLVDYFSTEHFTSIKSYQTKGLHYALVGLASALITIFIVHRERKRSALDNQLGLLPQSDTGMV